MLKAIRCWRYVNIGISGWFLTAYQNVGSNSQFSIDPKWEYKRNREWKTVEQQQSRAIDSTVLHCVLFSRYDWGVLLKKAPIMTTSWNTKRSWFGVSMRLTTIIYEHKNNLVQNANRKKKFWILTTWRFIFQIFLLLFGRRRIFFSCQYVI